MSLVRTRNRRFVNYTICLYLQVDPPLSSKQNTSDNGCGVSSSLPTCKGIVLESMQCVLCPTPKHRQIHWDIVLRPQLFQLSFFSTQIQYIFSCMLMFRCLFLRQTLALTFTVKVKWVSRIIIFCIKGYDWDVTNNGKRIITKNSFCQSRMMIILD